MNELENVEKKFNVHSLQKVSERAANHSLVALLTMNQEQEQEQEEQEKEEKGEQKKLQPTARLLDENGILFLLKTLPLDHVAWRSCGRSLLLRRADYAQALAQAGTSATEVQLIRDAIVRAWQEKKGAVPSCMPLKNQAVLKLVYGVGQLQSLLRQTWSVLKRAFIKKKKKKKKKKKGPERDHDNVLRALQWMAALGGCMAHWPANGLALFESVLTRFLSPLSSTTEAVPELQRVAAMHAIAACVGDDQTLDSLRGHLFASLEKNHMGDSFLGEFTDAASLFELLVKQQNWLDVIMKKAVDALRLGLGQLEGITGDSSQWSQKAKTWLRAAEYGTLVDQFAADPRLWSGLLARFNLPSHLNRIALQSKNACTPAPWRGLADQMRAILAKHTTGLPRGWTLVCQLSEHASLRPAQENASVWLPGLSPLSPLSWYHVEDAWTGLLVSQLMMPKGSPAPPPCCLSYQVADFLVQLAAQPLRSLVPSLSADVATIPQDGCHCIACKMRQKLTGDLIKQIPTLSNELAVLLIEWVFGKAHGTDDLHQNNGQLSLEMVKMIDDVAMTDDVAVTAVTTVTAVTAPPLPAKKKNEEKKKMVSPRKRAHVNNNDANNAMAYTTPSPFGLFNGGNTCYMSVVTQCIAALPPLKFAFTTIAALPVDVGSSSSFSSFSSSSSSTSRTKTNASARSSLLPCQLYGLLLNNMVGVPGCKEAAWGALKACHDSGQIQVGHHQDGGQEDVSEFVGVLINLFENHGKLVNGGYLVQPVQLPPSSSSSSSFSSASFPSLFACLSWRTMVALRGRNLIQRQCGIPLQQFRQCGGPGLHCSANAAIQVLSTLDLPIDEGRVGGKKTVQSLLSKFFEVERADIDTHCTLGKDKCHAKGGWMQNVLLEAPPVLMVALKRAQWKGDKAGKRQIAVGVSEQLTVPLMKLCDELGNQPLVEQEMCVLSNGASLVNGATALICSEEARYRLDAVIEHVGGSAKRGHFKAYVRKDATWLCYDDEKVTRVEPTVIQQLDKSAVFFCYQRVSSEWVNENGIPQQQGPPKKTIKFDSDKDPDGLKRTGSGRRSVKPKRWKATTTSEQRKSVKEMASRSYVKINQGASTVESDGKEKGGMIDEKK